MNGLKKASIELDRKVPAIAVFDRPAFEKIAAQAKASLGTESQRPSNLKGAAIKEASPPPFLLATYPRK